MIATIKKGLEALLDDQRRAHKDPTMCRAELSDAGSAEAPHISKRNARRQTSTSLPENASAMYLRGSPFPQEQMPHTESMAGTFRGVRVPLPRSAGSAGLLRGFDEAMACAPRPKRCGILSYVGNVHSHRSNDPGDL